MTRISIALSMAVIGAALFVVPAHSQVHGTRGSSSRVQLGRGGSARATGPSRGRLNSGFLFPPYFYPDETEYGPEPPPTQTLSAEPVQPPVPVATPIVPLLLENHDGQWVRIPTGSQIPASAQSASPDSAASPNLQSVVSGPKNSAGPSAKLPPAVLVFRDGHKEEVEKYMIQGDVLYTSADYWSTGSWTRKIPIAELDLPASVKLNQDRGAKFNLPAGPNEIVVRF